MAFTDNIQPQVQPAIPAPPAQPAAPMAPPQGAQQGLQGLLSGGGGLPDLIGLQTKMQELGKNPANWQQMIQTLAQIGPAPEDDELPPGGEV